MVKTEKTRKLAVGTVAVFMAAVSFSSLMAAGLREVPKPDTSRLPVHKLISDPSRPSGMKEIPFIDRNPQPRATAAERARGYILFSRPITAPIYKNSKPLARERIDELTGFSAQNAYAPLTFSIYPLRALKNFRVIVSALKSGKYTIARKDIELRLGTYFNIRYPASTSRKTYRNVQELLQKVSTASFKKHETQRYWIDIRVPKGTPAGIYRGTVTLFDDKVKKATELPIVFRVFDFSLKKDPGKHYSVFYYPPHIILNKYKGKLFDKALTADLKNMQKMGIDIYPSIYINIKHLGKDNWEFYIPEDSMKVMKKAKELGFKGPVYLAVTDGINRLYKYYVPDGKIGSHAGFSKMPKDNRMFAAIQRAAAKFAAKYRRLGYPEFMLALIDEPRAKGIEVTARAYAAARRGGVKTIVTNDPTSSYSGAFRKYDALDAWDSQAFAMPYESIRKDKKRQYWCYPNHNACEVRDAVVMQKGGRMTYGYGFWKSGYQVLNPWAWRWFPGGKYNGQQFDYLQHERVSGCGNRLDKQGNFIPAVYWICFREGYNDARYIYTLQQAMAERADSRNPECRKLLKKGQALLDEIWRRVATKRKYLKVDFFDDKSFDRIRWRLALLTEKLLRFPGKSGVTAPSVMANTGRKSPNKDDIYYIKKGMKGHKVDFVNLAENSFSGWTKSSDREITLKVIRDRNGKALLQMTVDVDYKVDGKNYKHPEKKQYPIGWPMIRYSLRDKHIKVSDYDFFYCKIKFNSNRDAVADNITNLYFGFNGAKGASRKLDLGGAERTWVTVLIPTGSRNFAGAYTLILLPAEHYYPDKTRITFTISDIGFVKFRQPFIKEIKSLDTVLDSDKFIEVGLSGYALSKGVKKGYKCEIALLRNGRKIASKRLPLTENFVAALPVKNLQPGRYRLKLSLYDAGNRLRSSAQKAIEVIHGVAKAK